MGSRARGGSGTLVERVLLARVFTLLRQEDSNDLELVVLLLFFVVVDDRIVTFGRHIGVLKDCGGDIGDTRDEVVGVGTGRSTATEKGVGGRGGILQGEQQQCRLHHHGQSEHQIHHC